jgi:hypothetical protein
MAGRVASRQQYRQAWAAAWGRAAANPNPACCCQLEQRVCPLASPPAINDAALLLICPPACSCSDAG